MRPRRTRAAEPSPAAEAAHQLLIQAYAAAGQTAQALRQYARCRAALARELGAEPAPATVALADALRAATTAAATVEPMPLPRIDNLPVPPTPLIGREREIETVQDLMLDDENRLVTLTGVAGIGKTRLALEAAAASRDQFAQGVAFVELAPVRAPRLVLDEIARVLAIREEPDRELAATLAARLRERQLLLVLDNFEHITAAAPVVRALLDNCPRLTVLATSRAPLRLPDERLFEVPPLTVSPAKPLAPASLLRYESVALFVANVQTSSPDFTLNSANAEAVAAICAVLEGLPLALELAAARARHLSSAALLGRLSRRLDVLTAGPRDLPARQQTLRATLAWSYELQTPAAQALFCLLSVFAGGCEREAAAWMARALAEAGILEAIRPAELDAVRAALTDEHLIGSDEIETGGRITMLETMREFGLEQLASRGWETAARQAHARYFGELAAAAAPTQCGHLAKAAGRVRP